MFRLGTFTNVLEGCFCILLAETGTLKCIPIQAKPTWEFVDFEPENLSLAVLKNKPIIRSLSFPLTLSVYCYKYCTLYLVNNYSRIFITLCFALCFLADLIMYTKTYLINICTVEFFYKRIFFQNFSVAKVRMFFYVHYISLKHAEIFFKGQIIYDLIIL
jgi:hypothetical protein